VLPAVNGTDTVVLFVRVTDPIVGAAGAENTNELDALDAADVALPFVAVTVYVRVPATVSVITIGLEAPVLLSPDELVTVYWVIGSLLNEGALNVTDAVPFPAVAVPIVGAVAGPLVAPDDVPNTGMRTPCL
jgi:hypothetical protein